MARQQTDAQENKVLADYLRQQDAESLAELAQLAQSYFTYYALCRQAGFDRNQALTLVMAMQTTFLENAYRQNKEAQDG